MGLVCFRLKVARVSRVIFLFRWLKWLSKTFFSGLQRAEPEAAGEDRQVPGDPPGALSAQQPICPETRRLRASHRVASHPASVAPHHKVGI